MDGRPAWTDCDMAGDYVGTNVFSPRDLVSRPDNMDEIVPHTYIDYANYYQHLELFLKLLVMLVQLQIAVSLE